MKKLFSFLMAVGMSATVLFTTPALAYVEPDFTYSWHNVPTCDMQIMVPDSNATNGDWKIQTIPSSHEYYGFEGGLSLVEANSSQGIVYRCIDFTGTNRGLFQYFRSTLASEYVGVTAVRTQNITMFDAQILVWEISIDDGSEARKAFIFTHNGKGYLFELDRGVNSSVNKMIARSMRTTQFVALGDPAPLYPEAFVPAYEEYNLWVKNNPESVCASNVATFYQNDMRYMDIYTCGQDLDNGDYLAVQYLDGSEGSPSSDTGDLVIPVRIPTSTRLGDANHNTYASRYQSQNGVSVVATTDSFLEWLSSFGIIDYEVPVVNNPTPNYPDVFVSAYPEFEQWLLENPERMCAATIANITEVSRTPDNVETEVTQLWYCGDLSGSNSLAVQYIDGSAGVPNGNSQQLVIPVLVPDTAAVYGTQSYPTYFDPNGSPDISVRYASDNFLQWLDDEGLIQFNPLNTQVEVPSFFQFAQSEYNEWKLNQNPGSFCAATLLEVEGNLDLSVYSCGTLSDGRNLAIQNVNGNLIPVTFDLQYDALNQINYANRITTSLGNQVWGAADVVNYLVNEGLI